MYKVLLLKRKRVQLHDVVLFHGQECTSPSDTDCLTSVQKNMDVNEQLLQCFHYHVHLSVLTNLTLTSDNNLLLHLFMLPVHAHPEFQEFVKL